MIIMVSEARITGMQDVYIIIMYSVFARYILEVPVLQYNKRIMYIYLYLSSTYPTSGFVLKGTCRRQKTYLKCMVIISCLPIFFKVPILEILFFNEII